MSNISKNHWIIDHWGGSLTNAIYPTFDANGNQGTRYILRAMNRFVEVEWTVEFFCQEKLRTAPMRPPRGGFRFGDGRFQRSLPTPVARSRARCARSALSSPPLPQKREWKATQKPTVAMRALFVCASMYSSALTARQVLPIVIGCPAEW